jgi:hypothetical protein
MAGNGKFTKCFTCEGEALREGFKSHKYVKYIYLYILILILHPFTPTRPRDALRAHAYRRPVNGELFKDNVSIPPKNTGVVAGRK